MKNSELYGNSVHLKNSEQESDSADRLIFPSPIPCGHCGCKKTTMEQGDGNWVCPSTFYLECNDCGIRTGERENEIDCIEEWNTRPSQWVSVSERLPELDVDVLVWRKGACRIGQRIYQFDLEEDKDSYRWYIDDWDLFPDVKFWMPLPYEPPKGEA